MSELKPEITRIFVFGSFDTLLHLCMKLLGYFCEYLPVLTIFIHETIKLTGSSDCQVCSKSVRVGLCHSLLFEMLRMFAPELHTKVAKGEDDIWSVLNEGLDGMFRVPAVF